MSSLPLDLLRSRGGFSRDTRFSSMLARASSAGGADPKPDPVIEAYERGFSEGSAHAMEAAILAEREREAQRGAIELAFAQFDEHSESELRERLRQTVLALCEATILPVAIDPAGLAARVEKATGMLQRAHDERRVLLNPEDLALVGDRLPAGLAVEPDPSVERGGLRIETADGGIEDGPAQWRRILAEAFREC
jgi:flagellar assembly protein FliH